MTKLIEFGSNFILRCALIPRAFSSFVPRVDENGLVLPLWTHGKCEEIPGRYVASVVLCLSNSPELGRLSGPTLPDENQRTAIREVFYGSLRMMVSGLAHGRPQ